MPCHSCSNYLSDNGLKVEYGVQYLQTTLKTNNHLKNNLTKFHVVHQVCSSSSCRHLFMCYQFIYQTFNLKQQQTIIVKVIPENLIPESRKPKITHTTMLYLYSSQLQTKSFSFMNLNRNQFQLKGRRHYSAFSRDFHFKSYVYIIWYILRNNYMRHNQTCIYRYTLII